MKRTVLVVALALLGAFAFSQERVAVFPFEVLDNVITVNEQKQFYEAFSIEFTEIGARAGLDIVPRANVDRLIGQEARFQLSDFSAKTKTAEMERVLNGTWILSGQVGKAGTRIQITVSLYSYPELVRQPGGATQRVANVDELFDKIPDLVDTMRTRLTGNMDGGTRLPPVRRTDSPAEYFITEHVEVGLIITGYTGDETDVVIPARINGMPVIGVRGYDSGAMGHRSIFHKDRYDEPKINSVVIPSSITVIGEGAFADVQLSSVNIPSSVTVIGDGAFISNRLSSVVIPSSVISIGEYAFTDNQLTNVVIPYGTTTIMRYAFSSNRLTSVVIPSSVTSIGGAVFSGNYSLTSISVAEGNITYTSVDGVLFSKDKRGLIAYPAGKGKNYNIPYGVEYIGDGAFYDTQLTGVTIPSGVNSIGDSAFCINQLTNVVIPATVTQIGDRAFMGNRLATLVILSSNISIGVNVFIGQDYRLTVITIGGIINLDNQYAMDDLNFIPAYYSNGRKAGRYTWDGNRWNYRQ
jgi:TolB-like protein